MGKVHCHEIGDDVVRLIASAIADSGYFVNEVRAGTYFGPENEYIAERARELGYAVGTLESVGNAYDGIGLVVILYDAARVGYEEALAHLDAAVREDIRKAPTA